MKTITLENGKKVEISDESYAALSKAVTSSHMPWRAKEGGRYFFIDSMGDTCSSTEVNHKTDDYRYLTGNYYQTEAEAEKATARQRAISTVRMAILEANEGWVPDWGDGCQEKLWVFYDYRPKRFIFTYNWLVVSNSVLPYIKTEQIAQDIINTYEKELKLIWGIE